MFGEIKMFKRLRLDIIKYTFSNRIADSLNEVVLPVLMSTVSNKVSIKLEPQTVSLCVKCRTVPTHAIGVATRRWWLRWIRYKVIKSSWVNVNFCSFFCSFVVLCYHVTAK